MPSILPQAFVLLVSIHYVRNCILLLDGWKPVPLAARASSAEVVAVARTLRTYKDDRTRDKTYSALFRFLYIHKGKSLLENVTNYAQSVDTKEYMISNFGDKVNCYADVISGKNYILFVTLFNDSLSAKYDDIFGAADEQMIEREEEVTESLGKKEDF